MPNNARVDGHIQRALQFETEHPGVPLPHWRVVIIYYSALHWLTAACVVLHEKRRPGAFVPATNTHGELRDLMTTINLSKTTNPRTTYEALEAMSRNARYATDGKGNMTQVDVDKALRYARSIQAWSVPHLTQAGYAVTAPAPPTTSAAPSTP